MAGPAWTADHPLARLILQQPEAFEFFQVLHLIERTAPGHAPLGEQNARAEAVRLRPALSLAFPAADLCEAAWLKEGPGDGRLQLTTTFLGLYGSDSPLPAHFTESLLSEKEEDQRVRAFIDLIHHRLLALLYRVWKKYRYHITLSPAGDDPISQVICGLLGLGTPHIVEQLRLPPVRLFRYVGLLTQRPRSAAGLTGLLRDFFQGTRFEVQQCAGRWLPIEPADRNRLGVACCGLGQDLLLGERIFDRSGQFRVRIGPVGFEQYTRFLPTGDEAAQLRELVHFYCADPLELEIEIILRGDEVPETTLGAPGLAGRLAWASWLKSGPLGDQAVRFRAESGDR